MDTITSAHLDYLQHINFAADGPPLPGPVPGAEIPAELRRLFRINAIGQFAPPKVPAQNGLSPVRRLEAQDLVIALSSYGIPVAFSVRGSADGVDVSIGTWGGPKEIESRGEVLRSALSGQFGELEMIDDVSRRVLPLGVLALGIPSARPADELDAPIDRIIRALRGAPWQVLVLAEPVNPVLASRMRTNAIEASRQNKADAQYERMSSPLAETYEELLKTVVKRSTSGLAMGMWRYAAYLMVDKATTLPALAGLWRGIFSGDESTPEPVVTAYSEAVPLLAERWILPETPAKPGPGSYKRWLEHQTILTSQELAQYVRFPKIDTPGFEVRTVARFDAAARQRPADVVQLTLGQICLSKGARGSGADGQPKAGPPFRIAVDSLVKHAFVAGVTGVGKTNTVCGILKGITAHGRSFLVIEPAKTEYRSLLTDPTMSKGLKIFTLGNVGVSPFALNPFEPEPGTQIGVHLDLLRSVFSASFGMWTPLPQILERCLQSVYEDRGWDLATGHNLRGDDKKPDRQSWPTLSDLKIKIEEIIPSLGYEEKIASDMRASLLTRVAGLSNGAKGQMLDTRVSTGFAELLDQNVVFELEGIADDDEKAFLIGLLLIRLIEVRRSQPKTSSLRHLLVIEEAHRLLANVGQKSSEEAANPRGKAVETFANLLSEIRSYGQGVLVADQVPVKLAPDVIKNTNLKIVHRVVAGDDRAAVASSMAMDEAQERGLAVLTTGQAAIFNEGEDAPLLVLVDEVGALKGGWPSNDAVRQHMLAMLKQSDPAAAREQEVNAGVAAARLIVLRNQVKEAVADPLFRRDFARLVTTLVGSSDGLRDSLGQLLSRVNRRVPGGHEADDFYRLVIASASEWLAERRGQQRQAAFGAVAAFQASTTAVLVATLDDAALDPVRLAEFQMAAAPFHSRDGEPFAGCDSICSPETSCRYRGSVMDRLASNPGLSEGWSSVSDDPDKGWDWLEKQAAYLSGPGGGRVDQCRAALCLAQHLFEGEVPEVRLESLGTLLDAAETFSKEGT